VKVTNKKSITFNRKGRKKRGPGKKGLSPKVPP